MKTGAELGQIKHKDFPEAWSLSGDGQLFALGTRDPKRGAQVPSRLGLWDARTGKHRGEFQGLRGFLRQVRFAPDGKTLAAIDAGDQTLHLWDVATRKERFWFQPKPRRCDRVVFSRDGRTLVVFDGETEILFVDAATGKELPRMPATESATKLRAGVVSLLLSPDDKQLIAADRNGKIFVFERASGRLLKEWRADYYQLPQLALSSDGKRLVTQGASTALVWDLERLMTGK